jgi:hypothetical protein
MKMKQDTFHACKLANSSPRRKKTRLSGIANVFLGNHGHACEKTSELQNIIKGFKEKEIDQCGERSQRATDVNDR